MTRTKKPTPAQRWQRFPLLEFQKRLSESGDTLTLTRAEAEALLREAYGWLRKVTEDSEL